MNVETCGHVADLTVMAHAFAELRDGVVAPARKPFQIFAGLSLYVSFRTSIFSYAVAIFLIVRGDWTRKFYGGACWACAKCSGRIC